MRKLFTPFITLLNNISLRVKLILLIFVFMALPFSFFIFFNYIKTSNNIKEEIVFTSSHIFEQTASYLNDRVSQIIYTSDLIISNETIQSILQKNYHNTTGKIGELDDFNHFTQVLSSLERGSNNIFIKFYLEGGTLFRNDNIRYFPIDHVKDSEWFEAVKTNAGKLRWLPSYYFYKGNEMNKKYISAARLIRDPINYQKTIGSYRIEIPEKDIHDIISGCAYTPSSMVVLFNKQDEIVTSTDNYYQMNSEAFKDLILQYKPLDTNQYAPYSISIGKKDYLLFSMPIQSSEWRLYLIIPYDDILNTTRKSRNQMYLLLSITLLFSYLASLLIHITTGRRISALIKNMNQVVKGDFNVSIIPWSNDEIGHLARHFNYMLTKISMLLEEKVQMGMEVKNSELKALQSQINPHFLYNTLDQINWMAMDLNSKEISSLVKALSNFYKLSLNKGEENVSIKDELEHVKTYVYIQNMRFDHRIQLVIENMEALYEFKVPKIILQPIVENSILHGILPRHNTPGTILIKGNIKDSYVCITVEDDGVGMSSERLQQVVSEAYESEGGSYCLKNIRARMHLRFGQESGLFFESEANKGTRVTLKIYMHSYFI